MRTFLALVMVITLIPAAGWAQGHGGSHGKEKGHFSTDDLGLDAKQKARFRDLKRSMKRFMIPHHAKIDLKKLDFEEELSKDSPDKAKLDKIIAELAELKAQHTKRRLEFMTQIAGILDPEQKAKFIEKRLGGQKGGHHGGGPRR